MLCVRFGFIVEFRLGVLTWTSKRIVGCSLLFFFPETSGLYQSAMAHFHYLFGKNNCRWTFVISFGAFFVMLARL